MMHNIPVIINPLFEYLPPAPAPQTEARSGSQSDEIDWSLKTGMFQFQVA